MTTAPHIVLIVSDQHNPRVTGYEGDPVVRTPALDALAEEGVAFSNCYCNSPLCVPSRSAMLSGLLPSRTDIYNNHQCLPSDRVTFLHSLAVAGYETVLCGRMHFMGPDQRHGYTRRIAGEWTPSIINYWEKSKHFGVLQHASGQIFESLERSGPGHSSVISYDRYVVDRAVHFLNGYQGDQPLFLTIGLFGPHCPYVCPPNLFDYYRERVPMPDVSASFKDQVHPAVQRWYTNRGVEKVPADLVRRARAAYYGLVELLDGYVAQIRAAVESALGEENTLLIYLSDHGDMVGDKGLWWKSNFYEGAVRVPFILRGARRLEKDVEPSQLISLVDLGPTLIDLASGPPLPEQAGNSLFALVDSDSLQTDERAVYSMLADLKGDAPSAMIRQGPWKLIRHHGYEVPQLFNLLEDPAEIEDLGNAPSVAAVRASLEEQLGAVWDGEDAARNITLSRRHQAIFHDFAVATGIEDRDQWYPEPDTDYLL